MFDSSSTQSGSQESNSQKLNVGANDSLAPDRQQAIICTNNDLVSWLIYASLNISELMAIAFHIRNPHWL